ncbi:hypothetical protein [Streptomyces sp. JNUCC 63]
MPAAEHSGGPAGRAGQYRRGVAVRVVLGAEFRSSAATQDLFSALGAEKSEDSWVHIRTTGAARIATGRSGMINHNEFLTFSRMGNAGEAEDVVIRTSVNRTSLNTRKGGHREVLFLSAEDRRHRGERPRQSPVCSERHGAGGGLRPAQGRGRSEAQAVGRSGCSIRIVHNDSNDVSKLSGHKDTKGTFTGSRNLDESSLRDNDETMLGLERAGPYDAYRQKFENTSAVATPS